MRVRNLNSKKKKKKKKKIHSQSRRIEERRGLHEIQKDNICSKKRKLLKFVFVKFFLFFFLTS